MRRAARIRQRQEEERDIVLAWQVEHIRLTSANKKGLPALKTFLQRGTGRQTVRQQRQVVQILSEQYGIPLRLVEKKSA